MKGFLEHVWYGYTALIIWWVPILLLFGFGGFLSLTMGELFLAAYELSIVLLPVPFLWVAYVLHYRMQHIVARFFIVYIFWCIVFFATCFVFSTALGGITISDGSNLMYHERLIQYARAAFLGVFYLQPLIFGLAALGTWLLHRRAKRVVA